jgi:GntR family galactonate operon transcriptional repressor
MMKSRTYPRRGLHGQVVHTIGLRILQGELKPGDPLPSEEELSSELAASRTVLREAVKVLAAKGLVEARPKTGTRVRTRSDWNLVDPDVLAWQLEAEPDGDFFGNVIELRRIIEPQAARLAAERATKKEIAALEEAFREMEQVLDDPEAYLAPDLRFHELILEACHNELLAQTASTMRSVFRPLFLAARTAETIGRATRLHGAIVQAIRARDGERAEDAMTELIDNTAAELRRAR